MTKGRKIVKTVEEIDGKVETKLGFSNIKERKDRGLVMKTSK